MKQQINKRNLSKSDSENKTTKFPRFIVIDSLEETFGQNFPSFDQQNYFKQRKPSKKNYGFLNY